jgi:regulator of cell morphogenesis and NO signaling
MEIEHEVVGDALVSIRRLTAGLQPPADACPTYCLLLEEIAAFERDFDAHVHLENHVLFPKAVELESTLEHSTRGLKCQQSASGTGDI